MIHSNNEHFDRLWSYTRIPMKIGVKNGISAAFQYNEINFMVENSDKSSICCWKLQNISWDQMK